MKRTNPEKGRGIDPKFVPISWDEALDIVADKMMELRDNHEPHKFVITSYSIHYTKLYEGTQCRSMYHRERSLRNCHAPMVPSIAEATHSTVPSPFKSPNQGVPQAGRGNEARALNEAP